MSDLELARLLVSEAALLSPRKAARLLGFQGAQAWIEENVPIREYAGRRRVRWGDVIAATDQRTAPVRAVTAARATIDDY